MHGQRLTGNLSEPPGPTRRLPELSSRDLPRTAGPYANAPT